MKTTINLNGQEIEISAKLIATGVNFPNSDNKTKHNRFFISITDEKERRGIGFNFYDSQHNYTNNIQMLSVSELINTVECFLSDAYFAENNFADFCSELGYEQTDKNAKRIYKLCEEANEKSKIFFNSEVWECLNAIKEINN